MKRILLLCVFACLCLSTAFSGVSSGVPNMMSYQGLLTTPSNAPVPDGSYDLQFELFYEAGGGSAIWTETQSGISVQHGTFSVLLGALVSLPDVFNAPLFLQATAVAGPGIGAPVTFLPRTTLASSAYALGLKLPFTGYSYDAVSGFSVTSYGSGSGISGIHESTSGTVAGVVGQTNSTAASALAVQGIVTSTSPGSSSTAVRGQNNGTGGLGIGVYGSQLGSGWGVYGYTPSGTSIYGFTGSGTGVYGYSQSGLAVSGYAAGNTAVNGLTNMGGSGAYGVHGKKRNANGGVPPYGAAVFGEADSAQGVTGISTYYAGVAGYNSGNGNGVYGYSLNGYGVLSYNKFAVLGTTGDTSVQLPDNAINSQEMLDEPGIANSISGDFFVYPPVGGSIAVDSVDITVPVNGYVEVSAGCYLNLWHDSGTTTELYLSIDETPGTAYWSLPGSIIASIPASLGTDVYQQGAMISRLYSVSAGTHRYYFNANYYSGTSTVLNLANPHIQATFYPTLYGSSSIATPSAVFDNASPSQSNGSHGQLTRSIQTVTMQQHNAMLEAKVSAVRSELEARIQKLEKLVVSQQQTQSVQQPPKQDQ